MARATTGLKRSIDSASEQLILAREKPSEAEANTAITLAPACCEASYPFSFGTSTWNSPGRWLTPRNTVSEFTICGIAFGDTKAPTSTVCKPAPTSASMNAMRSAALTGVFSFCRPSRGPTSTMRTLSFMTVSFRYGFDFREFDTFLHDIANLAFDRFQHAGKRRAQGLLHLHHLEGEDRRALLERRTFIRQQCHHGTRKRGNDLVFADVLLVVATERIDPMQLEPAVSRSQIQFVAFDHGDDMGFHAVERKVEPLILCRREDKGEFPVTHLERRQTLAVAQAHKMFGPLPLLLPLTLAEIEHPLPPTHRHPAGGAPRR